MGNTSEVAMVVSAIVVLLVFLLGMFLYLIKSIKRDFKAETGIVTREVKAIEQSVTAKVSRPECIREMDEVKRDLKDIARDLKDSFREGRKYE
jgi:uncharacterized protein YneF (UPF0154 family)